MIEFVWDIQYISVIASENNIDVVSKVRWAVVATNGTDSTRSGGDIVIPLPNGQSFIPYSQLTKDQIVEWVKSTLHFDQGLAIDLGRRLADMNKPKPLPWA